MSLSQEPLCGESGRGMRKESWARARLKKEGAVGSVGWGTLRRGTGSLEGPEAGDPLRGSGRGTCGPPPPPLPGA